MTQLIDLISNGIFIASASAWLVAQLLKVIINLVMERRFIAERLWGDGGMPSGHSATVSSLATMCGWLFGFGSVEFAISLMLAIIVMHDAMGVRREAGKQAVSIKAIAEMINQYVLEKDAAIRTDKLKVLVGHTPLQVLLGGTLGIVVATVYCLIFRVEYAAGMLSLF